ncbi:hypothetical protein SteCoe_18650 [Stentor coeruleus]|uniref:Uncharacterized protein n=1 Tax=Stentor coeruleus TaxID=5963 RepID=A0A1R2BVZ4_9CILI|nr:hypothetical protein SteCoe_18650 [Stentor coeruleus]
MLSLASRTLNKNTQKTDDLGMFLEGHSLSVNALALSSNEKILASGSTDKTIRVWDLENHQQICLLTEHTDTISFLLFPSFLISSSIDSTIRIWDPKNFSCTHIFQNFSEVNTFAVSIENDFLLSGCSDNTIKIWNLLTKRREAVLHGHENPIVCIKITSDDAWGISGSVDCTIKVWNISKKRLEYTLEGHTSYITCIAFSSKYNLLISGSSDNLVKLWNFTTKKIRSTFTSHTAHIVCVYFLKNDDFFISGSSDGMIYIWDLKTKLIEKSIQISPFLYFIISRIYNHIIGSFENTSIKAINIKNTNEVFSIYGHTQKVTKIIKSEKLGLIISSSKDATIRLWDFQTKEIISVLEFHSKSVNDIIIFEDDMKLISCSDDETVKIWDLENKRVEKTFKTHSMPVVTIFSLPNKNFLSVGKDCKCCIYSFDSKSLCRIIRIQSYKSRSFSLCTSRKYIVITEKLDQNVPNIGLWIYKIIKTNT